MRTTTDFVRFGPVRQETGAKHVRKGDLLEAINVRQTAKAGVYAKRKNFARTAQTFVGGSLSGTPETVLPGADSNSLMRDSGGQLWSRSNATNAWTYSGIQQKVWPQSKVIQSNLYTDPRPFSCVVGTSLWTFALTTNAYEFTITDISTGAVKTSKTAVTATAIAHASAAYDGSYVWVIWTDGGANGLVRCHKLDPASPTAAPTSTTYYTFGGGLANLRVLQVQARYMSVLGSIFVAACGGTGISGAMHSILNPATGAATAAGGRAVAVSITSAAGASVASPLAALCILDGQDGSGTYLYYSVCGTIDNSGNQKIVLVKVLSTTFATSTTPSMTHPYSGFPAYAYQISGAIDSVNDIQYLVTTAIYSALTSWGDTTATYGGSMFYSTSGAAVSQTAFTAADEYTSDWLCSGFATVGGRWFCLMAFDDYGWAPVTFGAESGTLQRTFHVYELVMGGATASAGRLRLVAQYLTGGASALWGRSSSAITLPPVGSALVASTAPVHVSGSTIYCAASVMSSLSGYVDVSTMAIDCNKTFGHAVQAGSRGYSPGNIPMTWNANVVAHPIVPLLFPPFIKHVAGVGTDFSIAAVTYAYYDADGTVTRSAPFVLSTSIGHGAVLRIPIPSCMRFGSVLAGIEVYIGNNATPKLQTVIPIPAAAYYVSFTTPTVAAMVNGEVLYTTGNALSQTWPVPCQAMGVWQNRLFAAQKNVIWTSKELEPGFGPLFNEVQTSTWSEERGDITAMGTVDFNYMAIFSASKPGIISGQGPDGVGNGNYTIRTLSSLMGINAGGIAIQGPQGCHYQDPGTGRLIAITPGLQVVDCGGGAWDYSAYAVTCAAWYESENLLVFFCPASSAALVIDYQHPQDVAPFGQMYLWTFAAGLVPSAVCIDSAGMLVASSGGGIFRIGSAWVDDNASGTTDTYAWKLATAELQLGDLQGEIFVSKVQALLTMRSAVGISISVYPGYASATASDSRVTTASISLPAPANVGDTENVMTRPAYCARIQSFRVVIQEAAGQTGQGAEFEGLAVEYQTTGRALHPNAGRVI